MNCVSLCTCLSLSGRVVRLSSWVGQSPMSCCVFRKMGQYWSTICLVLSGDTSVWVRWVHYVNWPLSTWLILRIKKVQINQNSSHKSKQKWYDLNDYAKYTSLSSENSYGNDKMRKRAQCWSLLKASEDGVTSWWIYWHVFVFFFLAQLDLEVDIHVRRQMPSADPKCRHRHTGQFKGFVGKVKQMERWC